MFDNCPAPLIKNLMVLINIYNKISSERGKKPVVVNENPPLNTPFVGKRDVDRSTLYSLSGPFEMLQADIADIRFLRRSAANPKYCPLLICSLL